MSAITQQLMSYGGTALNKAAVTNAFPASTFTTTGAAYQNLLNGSGGAAIQVTLTKGAGTRVLISAGGQFVSASNPICTLGVNDGTTDTDVCAAQLYTGASRTKTPSGDVLLSGLGAGTYTFTLRIKVSTSTASFTSTCSAYIAAWEVT